MPKKKYEELGRLKSRDSSVINIIKTLMPIAQSELNALILGEHGTGRSTVAGMIHSISSMRAAPMEVIACNGARINHIKLKPDCITYVDEVHLLRPKLQRRLKEEMYSVQEARVVASADVCITAMRDEGSFSQELYSMLAQALIGIPPLRDRSEDIGYMVRDALKKYNFKYRKSVKLDPRAMSILKHYRYPGNISELYNIIERAVLVCKSGVIKPNSIVSILDMDSVSFISLMNDSVLDYHKEMERFEREIISNALRSTDSLRAAARQLNIAHSSLKNKCERLGIELPKDEGVVNNCPGLAN